MRWISVQHKCEIANIRIPDNTYKLLIPTIRSIDLTSTQPLNGILVWYTAFPTSGPGRGVAWAVPPVQSHWAQNSEGAKFLKKRKK